MLPPKVTTTTSQNAVQPLSSDRVGLNVPAWRLAPPLGRKPMPLWQQNGITSHIPVRRKKPSLGLPHYRARCQAQSIVDELLRGDQPTARTMF